ncbi:MAG: hypothetical protein IJJ68_06285 [Prevotella sp.]|nr:hypothetical protein [Prevotella sp.]
MTKKIELTEEKPLTIEGFVTIQKKDDGLHTADFQCCEDVQMEPVKGEFKVQFMRDGNIYMDQKPKRIRNKPKFREDHSSLSITSHRQIYVVFCESVDEINEAPKNMVREVQRLAKKLEALKEQEL